MRAVRLRRLVQRTSPPYRVELGAGNVRRPGWIATDVWWRAPYYLDATGPWPFPPSSVSHVFADNMIEHVPLDGARRLFREAWRALTPGGVIRLITPDVQKCAEVYLKGGDLARAQMAAHENAGTRVEHRVDILRGVFIEYEHSRGYAYDFAALSTELASAGFEGITRCELGQSADPVLRELEARVLPIDRITMLAVEARRPESL